MRLLFAVAALLVASVSAIFEDEAYQLDYHHALVGQPIRSSTFFHQPYPNSKASLIYTFSERSIIGAINPKDGTLLWRQSISDAQDSSLKLLKAVDGQDILLSATDSSVSAWKASSGKLIWTYQVVEGKVKDVVPYTVGSLLKDVVILTQDTPTLVSVSGTSGVLQRKHEDGSGDVPLSVSVQGQTVYYVALRKVTLSGYRIKIASYSVEDGSLLGERMLPSDSEVTEPEHVLYSGSSPAVPVIVWTDKDNKVIKMIPLSSDRLSIFEPDRSLKIKKMTVVVPQSSSASPSFLIHSQTAKENWGEVFKLDLQSGQVSKTYELARLFGGGAFSASSNDAETYFTRVVKGGVYVFGAKEKEPIERYLLDDFSVPGVLDFPEPLQVISEVQQRSTGRPAVRAAIVFASGDWIMNLNGELAWHRPEALVNAQSAVLAELPLKESLAEELAIEGHSNVVSAYIHRLKRHANDIKQLPATLQALPERILASVTGQESKEVKSDTFGFRKFAVLATENGRLIALDASKAGTVAWNVVIPGHQPGQALKLKAMPNGTIRLQSDGSHLIFDSVSGKFLNQGDQAMETPAAANTIVYFTTTDDSVVGYLPGHKSAPLWRFNPSKGAKILSVTTRPEVDPVASIGKVLGDRRVLYKYLNPNLALVTTGDEVKSTLQIFLLDSISGKILHEAEHVGVDVSKRVAAVVSENWISYSFTTLANGQPDASQGSLLTIAELFESSIPDDRGALGAASNYSAIQPGKNSESPYVASQSYQISEEISHMSVSQTEQGITTRMLLAVLPQSQSIVGIPRTAIDPRRTIGRDPTNDEMMEGLSKYVPVLEFNPIWYLNHKREVYGIENVVASPAVLESTSLVFAYGFDVFGTRVSPSFSFDRLGKDFNKLQMLGTVAALAVATLVVAPLVARKQINMRWQIPS